MKIWKKRELEKIVYETLKKTPFFKDLVYGVSVREYSEDKEPAIIDLNIRMVGNHRISDWNTASASAKRSK